MAPLSAAFRISDQHPCNTVKQSLLYCDLVTWSLFSSAVQCWNEQSLLFGLGLFLAPVGGSQSTVPCRMPSGNLTLLGTRPESPGVPRASFSTATALERKPCAHLQTLHLNGWGKKTELHPQV